MSTKSKIITIITITLSIGIFLFITNIKQKTGNIKPAFDGEFMTRPDCYPSMLKHYDFKFKVRPMQMDPGLMYRAIHDGAVDVIDGYSTDGRIPAYDLLILKDDKNFFPPYYAAPLIRNDTLRQHPELRDVLNMLSNKFTDEIMQKLNYLVDRGGKKPEEVAIEYLTEHNMIPENPKRSINPKDTVTIGGKNFNEQEILGYMMLYLIEHYTDLAVELRLNLGGTMIAFNALKAGDIDIYPEYTGTGLVSILKEDVIIDPDESYNAVKKIFKERYKLVWLKPFGFNNTYTLTMRKKHAQRLGIETISDLVKVVRGETRN